MMVSVIIPALNEREYIVETLESLTRLSGDTEIIVVDGGSTDGTPELARSLAQVMCCESERGRAAQMNTGAGLATGDTLLFLHADTRLPHGAFSLIEDTLATPQNVGGCFTASFDRDAPLLRLYSFASRLDSVLTTFGDQALFIRRDVFERLGGFTDIPIMEDVDMLRRLKRMGPFVKLREPVVTSSRRFLSGGVFRQQIKNALLVGLYFLGVPPSFLTRFY